MSPEVNAEGYAKNDLIRDLAKDGYSAQAVLKAVEALCNDGVLYTTYDEDHLAAIDR